MPRLSTEERSVILANAIAAAVADGYTPVYQTPTNAVLKSNRRTSHGLHLLLTLLTFGAWLIVWIAVAALNTPKTRRIEVDEYGNVNVVNQSLLS